MKLKATIDLWNNGEVTVRNHEYLSPKELDIVETREIEWETKESVRVADYLVPSPTGYLEHGGKWYYERECPIGQQPEGAVLVPNSERNQE
jgi:hypothetical protein